MSEERNQALVRRFYEEVLSERNPEAAAELVTSDYVCHAKPFSPDLPAGIEGAQRFVTEFLSGYPQLRFKVEKQRVEGENVHSQMTASSSFPVGAVMSIPTDQPQDIATSETITGTTTDRIANGKIAESWIEFHLPHSLPQLEELSNE